ncbi:MAG: T9SS type A sorting domain-containing protein [Saprospiraceae bacterium]|nr:T9SS type A sorting domain-containing protein [Saprospiraceae bacterium]
MKIQYQLNLKALIASMLVVVCFNLVGAQTATVTLSFSNPAIISPTEIEFDVDIKWTGGTATSVELNAANVHAKYSPAANVPTVPAVPVYSLVEQGPHFTGMTFPPALVWNSANGVHLRSTQTPTGSRATAPDLVLGVTYKLFRAKLTTSAPMTDINVLFNAPPTTPSISMSLYINPPPPPIPPTPDAARTINVTGTAFGQVTLGPQIPFTFLPVELSEVEAHEAGTNNLIQWKTESELNSQYHIVERSADGMDNWTEIGRKLAAGTTQVKQAYSLQDERPLPMSYYRLKLLDFDGKFEYSKVVSVQRRSGDFGVVNVFPMPTSDKVTLQVSLPEFSNLTVSVTDVNGRLLQFSDMEVEKGLSDVQVDLTSFAAGTYFVKIDNGVTQLTQQIVKQ